MHTTDEPIQAKLQNAGEGNIHVGVIDGIRALAIIIVVWFHFWEQTWLMPILHTPSLSFLGIEKIDLDWIPRSGFEMVTMMLFLSAFCLYLPYANHKQNGTPAPSWKTFYQKRKARILPSYLFCLILITAYNLCTNAYDSFNFALRDDRTFFLKDMLSHLTFTNNLFPDVYFHTLLNGALWTVALEVQFYVLFPLLQKCFSKKPVLTYVVLNLIAYAFVQYSARQDNVAFLLHQFPSYLGVFANGFLGATIFVGLPKELSRNKWVNLLATIISLGSIYVYRLLMLEMISTGNSRQHWQMSHRFSTSLLYMVFVICTAIALPWYRAIFSNRVMRFLATISYNLYIWHQYLCLTFKQNRIPYYEGDVPPNFTGDRPWMWKLLILSIVTSLIMATATTYLIEKPCARLLRKRSKE